jgi:hypothetical protein
MHNTTIICGTLWVLPASYCIKDATKGTYIQLNTIHNNKKMKAAETTKFLGLHNNNIILGTSSP